MKKVLIGLGAALVLAVVALLAVGTMAGEQQVKRVVEVSQKPEEVFARLTALEGLPDMGLGVKSVNLPKDEKLGEGYRFGLETEYGPAEAEVTAWAPPEHLACGLSFRGRRVGRLELTLAAASGGQTEATVSLVLDASGALGGVYNLAAKKAVATALESHEEKLKEFLEAAK
jgi:uncharacterized membrane protein